MRFVFRSNDEAARVIGWLAASPEMGVMAATGTYSGGFAEAGRTSRLARDERAAARLWEVTEGLLARHAARGGADAAGDAAV